MSESCCDHDEGDARGQPPGQSTLRWRSATWARARARMLARLPRQEVPGPSGEPIRPLAALTTRSVDDPSIALVDSWAATCDVLSFYHERLLNEGYLGTAVELRSVVELARTIGHEPAPGVAASTRLALTVDPNTPSATVVVPAGTPVMSVPVADEPPVTYATTEMVTARADHNELVARRRRARTPGASDDELLLAGVTTGLKPGDPVVVVGAERDAGGTDPSERWDLRQVVSVDVDGAGDRTLVGLDRGLGDGFTTPPADHVRVVAFATRGRLFGADAPDVRMMSEAVRGDSSLVAGNQWKHWSLAEDRTRVEVAGTALDLDREYPDVLADGWICLQGPTQVELYRVVRANPASRVAFSLSGTVTRVFVDSEEHLDDFSRVGTAVLLGSRELALADEDDTTPVSGHEVELEEAATPLEPGQQVLVQGRTHPGAPRTVVFATVVSWTGSTHPVVELDVPLPALERTSAVLHGNVVRATHGAPVGPEVLGSGDAGTPSQSFRLGHAPLTWVQDPAGAVTPELEVQVGGQRWDVVDSLYEAGPGDHALTLDVDPEGHTVLTAGDGRRGARLPTGEQNVVATYRAGLGLAGQVAADQLTLLQQRPPGLLGVTNPAPATGGADPDTLDLLRDLAPREVLTLGRLVSLQDYADLAAAWPGVGKARADALWDGNARFVHLTLAAADGQPFPTGDDVLAALARAVDEHRDPAHRVVLGGFLPAPFRVHARIAIDGDRILDQVRADATGALEAAFAFPDRDFGQPVLAAEVVALLQGVAGVHAVDLEELRRTAASGPPPEVPAVAVPAALPTWGGGDTTPAELLVLGRADITLTGWQDTP